VIEGWQVSHPAAPNGIAIITADPARAGFVQHYFDSGWVVRLLAGSTRTPTPLTLLSAINGRRRRLIPGRRCRVQRRGE
jgi:hypothetical protein